MDNDRALILSGMIVNDDVISAQECIGQTRTIIPELSQRLEEADLRIIPHAKWAVDKGCERLVILANDTDVVALLLYYADILITNGLKELWVQYGTGEK